VETTIENLLDLKQNRMRVPFAYPVTDPQIRRGIFLFSFSFFLIYAFAIMERITYKAEAKEKRVST